MAPLPDEFMTYPRRRYGMDQDLYAWSDLFERPPVCWPGGARVALWVTPIAQWFPLDGKTAGVPGGLTMPYPDYRHYSNRDYGNRVGIYRVLDLLAERGLPASVALNAAVAERYPSLLRDVVTGGHEVVAHGLDMSRLHMGAMPRGDEEALVRRTLDTLRDGSGQAVTGWLSPGRSQTHATPDLLAAAGIRYCCDFANDDMPFSLRTEVGPLVAMPLAQETDDRVVLLEFRHTEASWVEQVCDRFDVLYREAERYGGRILSLPLHAWVTGAPYRIGYVREILDHVLGHEGVWAATGADILAAWQAGGSESVP